MHRAAQYLATAAISFLEKKDDDSHTNLGWNTEIPGLETHPLTHDGQMLALNYASFSLEWRQDGKARHTFPLEGSTHAEAINWVSKTSKEQGLVKEYSYSLHYELPYEAITDGYRYTLEDREQLDRLVQIRSQVNNALFAALQQNGLQSDVRIWPHHFDSGGFAMANDILGIGLGMAVPDTMINDFYLYVSGYHGHNFVDTAAFGPLQNGTVYSEGWKGIALAVHDLDETQMVSFFNEAISRYLS